MFFEQLVNGVTLGGIYAIVALGYTLVFGVLDIINMAHGEIFMIGSFVGMLAAVRYGLPAWQAILAGTAAAALLGYLLERIALRPLRAVPGSSSLPSLISTIGVSILLENVSRILFGAGNRPFPTDFAEIGFPVLGSTVYLVQVVVLLVSFLLMGSLSLFLGRTKQGRALRATAESPETAALLGVDTGRVITATVVLASAMGGVAGVLVGMSFACINSQMGLSMGLKGLAIIIFGGMGSVAGAVAGGLLLGLAETFVVAYGASGYRDAIAFVLIIVVLLVRPQGLFGTPSAGERA